MIRRDQTQLFEEDAAMTVVVDPPGLRHTA
jgi:hypothetical protein